MDGPAREALLEMADGDGRALLNLIEQVDAWKLPKKIDVDGHQYPDYAECVAISTAGAQKEMVVPSLLAIIVPIAAGLVLGDGQQ